MRIRRNEGHEMKIRELGCGCVEMTCDCGHTTWEILDALNRLAREQGRESDCCTREDLLCERHQGLVR
jgi:hypothetical protein